MADISGNTCILLFTLPLFFSSFLRTWSHADIIESELGDTGVELHQQGQRLADAAGSTKNSNFGVLVGHWSAIDFTPDQRVGYLSSRRSKAPTLDLSKELACERHDGEAASQKIWKERR